MTTDYRDIEEELIAWVKTRPSIAGAGVTFKTDSPLPFWRVSKIGGTDDGVTDFTLVDVDIFAETRDQAQQISEDIRTHLRPRIRAGSAIVDSVRTSVSPRQLPWDNASVRKFGATYAIGLRR